MLQVLNKVWRTDTSVGDCRKTLSVRASATELWVSALTHQRLWETSRTTGKNDKKSYYED